jgi:hypothetical protein
MSVSLSGRLGPHLAQALEGLGFAPCRLKVSRGARSVLQVRSGALCLAAQPRGGVSEFLCFQVHDDATRGVSGIAGWMRGATIPAPASLLDLPAGPAEDAGRAEFAFPFFSLPLEGRLRLEARVHVDRWLLVAPQGPVPAGGDDQALAERMAALLVAYERSAQALASPELDAHVQALAWRIGHDVGTHLVPYFEACARLRGAGLAG